MTGWFLTMTRTNQTKWPFPAVVLHRTAIRSFGPRARPRDPARPLHTNFKLTSNAGGYLALLKGPTIGFRVHQITPAPTVQYLIWPRPGGFVDRRVLTVPTRARRIRRRSGLHDATDLFNRFGCLHKQFVDCDHYWSGQRNHPSHTGWECPTNSSPLLFRPITVSGNMTIKARVYQSWWRYLFPQSRGCARVFSFGFDRRGLQFQPAADRYQFPKLDPAGDPHPGGYELQGRSS